MAQKGLTSSASEGKGRKNGGRFPPARMIVALVALALLACGRRGDPVAPGLRLPGAPTQIALSGPDGLLTLAWKPPREDLAHRPVRPLSGYLVLRQAWPPGLGPCPSCPEDLAPAGRVDLEERQARGLPETEWVDGDIAPGWTYRYRVRALDRAGHPGPPSASATITWIALPAPGVEATAGDGQAILHLEVPRWPSGLKDLGTRIYGPRGRRIAEAGPKARQMVVPGLENGVPVTLSVRVAVRTARGWDVESPGLPVTVKPMDTTPPPPPWALAAFVEKEGVRLRWLPTPGEAYAQVVVLRAREGGPFSEIARLKGDALSYLDEAVEPGNAYLYTVVAVDRAGNRSLPARDVRVRTPK